MGRHFAGHGFLSAFARYTSDNAPIGYVRNAKIGQDFCSLVRQLQPDSSPNYIVSAKAGALKEVGCLFTPSPINTAQAWQRELHGLRSWSLCGVNHTPFLSPGHGRADRITGSPHPAVGRHHLHLHRFPSPHRPTAPPAGPTSAPAP